MAPFRIWRGCDARSVTMREQLVDRLRVRVGVPGFRIIPNGAVTRAEEVPWRVAAEAGSAAGGRRAWELRGETVCAVAAGRRGLEEKTLARERRSRKLTYRRQMSRRQGDAADVGCPIRGKHHMAAGLEGFGRSGRGRGRRGGQPDAGGPGGRGIAARGRGSRDRGGHSLQRERGAGARGLDAQIGRAHV